MLSVCTSGWGFHPVVAQGSVQISAMRGLYLFGLCYKGSEQISAVRGLYLFVLCYKAQHKLAQ